MKTLFIIFVISILSACGGGNGGGGSNEIPDTFSPFVGTYTLTVESTTTNSVDGRFCGDASGTLIIDQQGVMESSFLSEWGVLYNLSGTALDSGEVVAGYAKVDDIVAATFLGNVKTGGTWIDLFECEGVWSIE